MSPLLWVVLAQKLLDLVEDILLKTGDERAQPVLEQLAVLKDKLKETETV
jgi:hypothetical protein